MFGQRHRRLHNIKTAWLNLLCVCWHIIPIVAVLTTYREIGLMSNACGVLWSETIC